ncbi:hypothetical protein B0H13DRAFT_2317802 [Mycena leptocephala]|nr:hypothetical protein B0H13DRAFT_2317802 [Mycena leptocephala]
MLLEILDDDAALLFALLPNLRQRLPSQDAVQVLDRVQSQIEAEGRRRRLHWVFVDDDIEMGVAEPCSDSRAPSPSLTAVEAIISPPLLLSPLPNLALGLPSSPSLAPTSPTLTAVPSPPATLVDLDLGTLSKSKRNSTLAGLDTELILPLHSKRTPTSADKTGANVARGAGQGSGGQGGNPRRVDCPARGASSARAHRAPAGSNPQSIADIQRLLELELDGEQDEDEEEEEESMDVRRSSRKAAKPREKWNTKGQPPLLCSVTARPIVWLSYIATSPERQDKLKSLLMALSSMPAVASSSPQTVVTIAHRCAQLELETVVNDFHQMMSFIHFALFFAFMRKSVKTKDFNFAILERECKDLSITQKRLQKWFTAGSRLVYLAASSSLYIIPILAACGMRSEICFKHSCKQIQVLAFTLSNPAIADNTYSLTVACGKLVREVIAPQMALIKQLSSTLEATLFCLSLPSAPGSPSSSLGFSQINDVRKHLRAFKVNFFPLPLPDPVWELLETDMLAPAIAPVLAPARIDSGCVAPEVLIVSPLKLQKTSTPVNKQNRVDFTLRERALAANALEVKSLEDLGPEVRKFHAGGSRQKNAYIGIDTRLANGKVLHFRDSDNRLVALVATNLVDTIPHLKTTLLTQLASVMTGEVHDTKSSMDHAFLAWHCNVWNRYGEKGDQAPKGIHPNYVQKEGRSAVNHTQRVPYVSKEIEENPEEAELLAEMIHLITIIVEYHLKKILPEEYEALKASLQELIAIGWTNFFVS